MIIAIFVVVLIRIMVDIIFVLFYDTFAINHIRLPEPGWQLQTIKFVLTLMLATPIVGVMSVYPK